MKKRLLASLLVLIMISLIAVCITMILVMLLVVFGFIRVLEMKGGDKTGEVVSANASAEISEHGQGADDRRESP